MTIVDQIKIFIRNLEEKDFYIYIAAFFLTFFLFMGLLIFWHKSKVNYWQKQLNELKKQRTETRHLLDEYASVELDRQKVNDILSTGTTSFKIRGYYDDLVNKHSLNEFKTKEPSEPQTTQLESGEKERTLTADFHDLNMKQVTDILKDIEDNPRVYAKKINIDKVAKDKPTLNVTVEIATIEPSTQQL